VRHGRSTAAKFQMGKAKSESASRTEKLERAVAELVALPLMRENVFHSAKYLDSGVEKELCDVLLLHRGKAIVVSIKAQSVARDEKATARWLEKAARKAVAQMAGAYRTLQDRTSWCDQQGARYHLQPGETQPVHGVVLLESDYECEVALEQSELALSTKGIPSTFMTLKDFVFVASYLRTWRDIASYLSARSVALRDSETRTVGCEYAIFCFYTVMRDSFTSFRSIADAKVVAAAGKHVVDGSAFRDRERGLAFILEKFIEQVSTCHEVELPPEGEVLARTAVPLDDGKRRLREELCDLGVQDRAAIGEQIGHICGRVANDPSFRPLAHGAVRLPSQRDKVYVIVVGWNAPHAEAGLQAADLGLAACHHYKRRTAVVFLINQVGEDVRHTLMMIGDRVPGDEYEQAAQEHYGHIGPRRTEPGR
jgi:hypothetical protein